MTITVKWIDAGREPKVQPNPNYPNGIDVDLTGGKGYGCKVDLPYPAKRIGHFEARCDICGAGAVVTTAGRVDDPRTLTLACAGKRGTVQ